MATETANDIEAPDRYYAYRETRTYQRKPIVSDEFEDGQDELRRLYRSLAMCRVPEDEDAPSPTDYALDRAYELIGQAGYVMMREQWTFPRGYVVVNDRRGIRIEWWRERTHCVTLVVAHDPQAPPSYVFSKLTADGAGDMHPAYPGLLAKLLSDLHAG
jgi:hypothetical protein